jgi:SNF2 family DNA or RNA helicase
MTITTSPVRTWAHQAEAFSFVQGLWKSGMRGALLAVCMGGGKSRIAVDLANDLKAMLVLIVCPLRVVEVWRAQFARFSQTDYEFLGLDSRAGSVREKTGLARDELAWTKPQLKPLVIAINYDSARMEPFASWALANIWDLIILDESHRIKSPSGRTSRFCAQLGMRAHHRLALTGTPMPHCPLDIWAQFRFLAPRLLEPTFGGFRYRHAVMGGYFDKQIIGWKNLEELNEKFRQIAFRVDESVLDLPETIDQVLATDLSKEGARIYGEMEREMVAWIADSEACGVEVTAANAMVRLLRLQQITGGTLPSDDGLEHHVDRAKEELLADFLEDLAADEPVVVFGRFRSDLAAIHRAAQKLERKSGELSGRRDDLTSWQRGSASDPVVLAVQIQAGGLGVDMTRARIAIYFSLGFSLADYLQSRARIHRPPQKRSCAFYHIQIRNSVDEYVLQAVGNRQELIERTLQELKKKRSQDHGHSCP